MGPYRIVARVRSSPRWAEITLGEGEVFNPDDRDVYRIRWIEQPHDAAWKVEWANPVEVVPGFRLPRTLRFRIEGGRPAEAELTAWSTVVACRHGRSRTRGGPRLRIA